jgi:DNA-binding response OmpR family regulator
MKVLVIEDDPGIVEVVSLCFQLRWSGTAVISATDGRKGIDLVETPLLRRPGIDADGQERGY